MSDYCTTMVADSYPFWPRVSKDCVPCGGGRCLFLEYGFHLCGRTVAERVRGQDVCWQHARRLWNPHLPAVLPLKPRVRIRYHHGPRHELMPGHPKMWAEITDLPHCYVHGDDLRQLWKEVASVATEYICAEFTVGELILGGHYCPDEATP